MTEDGNGAIWRVTRDADLWFEETRAVTPLPTTLRGVPESYPSGL